MNKSYEVLIVGAGVTGLTVAALLAQCRYRQQLRLTVVDAAPRPVHDPDDDVALRVSAISTGSARLLDSIGAWQYAIPEDQSEETVDWDTFLGSAPNIPYDPLRIFRWRIITGKKLMKSWSWTPGPGSKGRIRSKMRIEKSPPNSSPRA